MKKIITPLILVIVLLITTKVNSQTSHPFELGLNAGASWYKSDVKMKKLGGAGGFTFGQMYCMNKTSALYWGWRFRYLNATAYGQDYTKSYGIKNNLALNGTNDTAANYYSNGGYVYQNYKSTLNEASLEVVIGLNQLREKTHVLLYVFGGAGLTKAVTKINQLDGNNKRYNYSLVDSAGTASSSNVLSRLNDIYDATYETTAEGSKNPQWRFMPSLGIGLGYQFGPGFSMGVEHKVTWALYDLLDGQQWNNANSPTGTNDMYHYSSIWMKFTFGRGHKTAGTTTTETTNSNVNNYTTNNTAGEKPTIVITNPGAGNSNVSQNEFTYTARVDHVNSQNDISVIYNGISNTNFTYDAYSHSLTFPVVLANGNNTFMITATNASGSTSVSAPSVFYNGPVVQSGSAGAPVVSFFSPNQNPYTTDQGGIAVSGSVLNINNKSQMQISVNGVATTNFTYSESTHTFNINSVLVRGTNVFVVSASNPSGSDSKSTSVIYQLDASSYNGNPSAPPPVITITGPSSNPYTSVMSAINVTATVLNVTMQSEISVMVNGVYTNSFTYNPAYNQLSLMTNLVAGTNTIIISATTPSGSDSKPVTIIYSKPAVAPPPVITLITPSYNPYTTTANAVEVIANVQYVTSYGEITVSVNGAALSPSLFNFNPASGQLTFNANLINGSNSVVISASNGAGVGSQTQTIIYEQMATLPKPVVTITAPTSNPFNTSLNVETVDATVLNVTSASQIMLTLNGTITSAFSFNAATHQLIFNTNLIAGANTVSITATNPSGSDSKTITAIYTQPVSLPKPVVSITIPTSNPFNTSISSETVNATVLNVASASQIMLTLNGTITSAFSFNTATHQLIFNAGLLTGANTISITATNPSGSDSKTITVVYTQPVSLPKPVVSITTPTSNPFNTTVYSETVYATVLNVTSASQIMLTLNGVATSAFSFNAATHQLSFNANLIAGSNTVSITATNTSGSDSKTINVIYTQPVSLPKPVVTITSPASNPFNTTVSTETINATVLNVTYAGQIMVTLNGAVTSAFSFNAVTHQLSFNINLLTGANAISITATNTSGSDSKTITVIYKGAPPVLAPVVSILNPPGGSANSDVANYNFVGMVLNVSSPAEISLKLNGVAVSGFTYESTTKRVLYTATLVKGPNTIVLSASNPGGSDSKTATVTYFVTAYTPPLNPQNPSNPGTPPNHTIGGTTGTTTGSTTLGGASSSAAPQITLMAPATTPFSTNAASTTVMAKVDGIAGISNVVVKLNGAVLTTASYVAKTKSISVPVNLIMGANTVIITATNASGTKSSTIVINRH